nr:MAG TPA: Major head protein [Caudoviricetes sp.]
MSEPNTDTPPVVQTPPVTDPVNPPAENPPAKPVNDGASNADFAKMRVENNKLKKQLEAFEEAQRERDFAKMSKEQRAKVEFDDERAKFESDRKAFMQEKQQAQIAADLSEKGLPKAFSKVLAMVENDEEVLALIDEAVKEQTALIDSKTKALLAGNPPKVSRNTGDAPVTKEAFSKMNYAQKMELYQTDKELYQKLKEA